MQESIKHIKQQTQLLIKEYNQLKKSNAQLLQNLAQTNLLLEQQKSTIEQLQQKLDAAKLQTNISSLNTKEKQALIVKIENYLNDINTGLDLLNKV